MSRGTLPSLLILRLFGGVALERDGRVVTGRAVQRRRLALLVVLATAPGRTLARDRITALLWPDSTREAGRHLLAGAVYELRRALGSEVLVSAGDQLHLGDTALQADVWTFDQVWAAGCFDRAADLYAGPVADGFYIAGSPELDHWLDAARARYRIRHRQALERLAFEREAGGDFEGAASAWGTLHESDPADAQTALACMCALARAGRRGAALRVAERHIRFAVDEIGAEPDPAVERLAATLRDAPDDHLRAPPGTPGAPTADQPLPADGPGAPPVGPSRERSRSGRVRRGRVAAALVAGALLAWGVRPVAREDQVTRVAVLPFLVQGPAGDPGIGERVPLLLSAAMDGAGAIRAIGPEAMASRARGAPASGPREGARVARSLGADVFVSGSIVAEGTRLQVRASLHRSRRPGAPRVDATASGSSGSLLDLADALGLQLLSGLRASASAGATPAAAGTGSLAAFRAYLAGEGHLQAGRHTRAADAFLEATRHDSTFAMAHYRLSLATLWADRPGAYPGDSDARALRHTDPLPERARRLLRTYAAWRGGWADDAERGYRDLVRADSSDAEAWFQLGETLFHYNPLRGRPVAEARAPFQRALRLEPSHWGARWHLLHLSAAEGRSADAGRTARHLLGQNPEPRAALELRVLEALVRRDAGALPRQAAALDAADEIQVVSLATRAAVLLDDLPAATWLAGRLTRPDRGAYARLMGHDQLLCLALARGRRTAAREHLTALATFDGSEMLALNRRVLAALAPVPASAASLREVRDAVEGWRPAPEREAGHRLYLLGVLSAALGEADAALAHAARLDAQATLSPEDAAAARASALRVRAHVAWRAGRPGEALRLLEHGRVPRFFGLALSDPYHAELLERWARAEVLVELGRPEEALGWYRGFGEHATHDLVFLGPALLRQAEILHRAGDLRGARERYRRAARLWSGADPELQARLDSVGTRLQP